MLRLTLYIASFVLVLLGLEALNSEAFAQLAPGQVPNSPVPEGIGQNPGLDNDAVVDRIVGNFNHAAEGWGAVLRQASLALFIVLLGIDLAWELAKYALNNSGLTDITRFLFQRTVIAGVYLLLIQQPSFIYMVVDTFAYWGGLASGKTEVSPAGVFNGGLTIVSHMWEGRSWFSTDVFALAATSIIIMIVFALLTAALVMALVQVAIVIHGGQIMLAFAGFRGTETFATNYLNVVMQSGIKLFSIYLIMSIGFDVIDESVNGFNGNSSIDHFGLVGSSIILLSLVIVLPSYFQSIATGQLGSAGNPLAAGAIAGAATGAVAGGAIKAGGATLNAGRGVVGAANVLKAGAGAVQSQGVASAGKALAGATAGYGGAAAGAVKAALSPASDSISSKIADKIRGG